MRLTILLLLTLVIIRLTTWSDVAYSIVKRNSPDYPVEELNMTVNDLRHILEELRKLNDTQVDYYIDEIEKALEEGDYDKASQYLELLKQYLKEKYSGNTSGEANNELSKYIALIESIEEVNNETVTLDIEKLLKAYKNIPESSSSESKISLEDLYNMLNNIVHKGGQGGSSGSQNNILSPSPSSNYNSWSLPTIPSLTISPNIPLELVMLTSLLLVLGIVLYVFRNHVREYLKPVKKGIYTLTYQLSSIILPVKDPVVKLYNKWYLLAKLHGYKKYKWETPREFLAKISDEKLRGIGGKVTRLYEDRVYGGLEIEPGIIAKVSEEIRLRGR